ncbi:hypothetical protein BTH42_31890 [Burkholderia sp. SRS-W-2-2016]|uniref:hypothetical protein n=1 Tax=Burkholderia sp. SRS-W-2-2016 TaxID=1926878 RepID=UPI00094B1DFF|nr:hypothetical protein [Burkholderia sp. SRS-W-2-2016]OLL27450.1 hypothetical protein BTH42_31890 [Burkholderia sp. SRS-W-2-2016]
MSWLKIESNTPDKPEVWAIAAALSMDRDAVFGKLFRVWRWFDEHTENGNARSVTKTLVDETAGVSGFADAMIAVGWLSIDDDGISMPHFDWHTGASAKKRAHTAIRVHRHKTANAQGNADANDAGNALSVSETLPREEKIREEVNLKPKPKNIRASRFDAQARLESFGVETQIASDWLTLRSGKRLKPTETAFAGVLLEAQKAGLSMNDALRLCCTRGWGGFEAHWLLDRTHHAHGPPPALTPLQQREAEHRRVAQGLTRMNGSAPEVIDGAVTEVHRVVGGDDPGILDG